jgi:small subunit ribosomal protein MRP21
MVSRSLGELLLRPANFTRTPHASRRIAPSWTCQRAISNTPRQLAQPLSKGDDEHYIPEQEAQRPQARYMPEREAAAPQPRPQSNTQNETSQAIDSLFGGMPRNTTSPPPSGRPFGAEFAGSGSRRPGRMPGLKFDQMAESDGFVNPSLANKLSNASPLAVQQEETFAQYPRLNPAYGRTIDLDNSRGRDIVRGIGMLGSLMARNKVKSDFNKQKFHERGGLKRKRLASERWRARFQKGFRDITYRVTELTRKGW